MKITHLTTAHPRLDTRIFLKQCRSMATYGHSIRLVVADGLGAEEKDGVAIEDIGASSGRVNRMSTKVREMCSYAMKLDTDIFHLHDPELLSIALRLKKSGKKVIFDAHEDLPKQVLGKPYLNKPVKLILSFVLKEYEKIVCKQLDGIVAATPYIRDKFRKINSNVVDVNNYPIRDELVPQESFSKNIKRSCISYIGGLSRHRGIVELAKAVSLTSNDIVLKVAGKSSDSGLEAEIASYVSQSNFQLLGWQDRAEVKALLSESIAGMVTLHPLVNYLDSLPIKMFEYMSAGVPVIASDFPLWKSIVEKNKCGICVDPLNPHEIAAAIDYLQSNPDIALKMGERGKRLVREKYSWERELPKLQGLYAGIM